MQQVPVPSSLSVSSAPAARLPRLASLALFTVALCLSARVRIYLPWTPVPVTLQDLVVLLCGALLGSRAGVAATLAYLGLGAAGLPVFSSGAGLAYLAGPTGGYLVGFVVAAAVVGALPTVGRSWGTIVLSLSAGEALIHLFGVLGLAAVQGLGLKAAFLGGSLTFLPISVAKVGFAATLVHLGGARLARLLRSRPDVDSKRTSVCA
jgi:biotin transport system substrate-specific component